MRPCVSFGPIEDGSPLTRTHTVCGHAHGLKWQQHVHSPSVASMEQRVGCGDRGTGTDAAHSLRLASSALMLLGVGYMPLGPRL